jgi:hypothetical protein
VRERGGAARTRRRRARKSLHRGERGVGLAGLDEPLDLGHARDRSGQLGEPPRAERVGDPVGEHGERGDSGGRRGAHPSPERWRKLHVPGDPRFRGHARERFERHRHDLRLPARQGRPLLVEDARVELAIGAPHARELALSHAGGRNVASRERGASLLVELDRSRVCAPRFRRLQEALRARARDAVREELARERLGPCRVSAREERVDTRVCFGRANA